MSSHISRSEILGTITQDNQEYEVCATVEGAFDQEHGKLNLSLESFLRPTNLRVKEAHLHPAWLPKAENLVESVSQEEAPDLAREIFHNWVTKVRRSVTSTLHA